jgi:low affinity Fe/Cu permease
MNASAMLPGDQKLKSYWNRPGGPVKVIAGIAALAAIGYYVFPFLTQVVWNTLNFGIACLCLFVFVWLVTNRALRLRIQACWDILMKYTLGLIIEWDPFILAEDQIRDMKKQREKVNDLLTNEVGTEKERTKMTIEEKQKELIKCKATVASAKGQKGYEMAMGNAANQAQRCKEFIDALNPIYEDLCKTYNYLDDIYTKSAYMIADAEGELDTKKQLYRAVTSSSRALNAAVKLFKGDPEKQLMAEQSMSMLKDNIAQKVSSMKRAISCTSEYMKSIDLDTAASQRAGLDFLENFDPETEFKLLSDVSAKPAPVAAGELPVGQYDDLLKL